MTEKGDTAHEIERLQTALSYHVDELQKARRQAISDAAEIDRLRAGNEWLRDKLVAVMPPVGAARLHTDAPGVGEPTEIDALPMGKADD